VKISVIVGIDSQFFEAQSMRRIPEPIRFFSERPFDRKQLLEFLSELNEGCIGVGRRRRRLGRLWYWTMVRAKLNDLGRRRFPRPMPAMSRRMRVEEGLVVRERLFDARSIDASVEAQHKEQSQMTGHVRRRGERSWEIKFDLGADALTGKRRIRYVAFKGTKRAAEIELARLVAQNAAGESVDPSKSTVAEFVDRWERDWATANVGPKTLERYRQLLRLYVKPHTLVLFAFRSCAPSI
jgi:hypothetical protein